MTTEKFLEFNGKKLTLINEDGKFFIALKPICEVLEVDWEGQRQAIERHPIFKATTFILKAVGADGRTREMVCIPEKFIYGWLLSFSPKNEQHIQFQLQCYEVLYSHFHNVLSQRVNELQKRQQLKDEYRNLHTEKMLTDPNYQRMMDIGQTLKLTSKSLSSFDSLLLSGQLEMDFDK